MGKKFQIGNARREAANRPSPKRILLDVDLGAGFLKLLLEVSSFALGDRFLDRLRSAFDEVLGFLEAETGDGADFLDDLDLLVAGRGQDNGELGLLLGGGGSASGLSAAAGTLPGACPA